MLKFNDPPNFYGKMLKSVRIQYPIPESAMGGIAVDIGANLGAFPVVNHKKFNRIICIEPSQDSVDNIFKNLNAHNITNAEVYRLAVSNVSDQDLRLHPYKTHNYSGNAITTNSNYLKHQYDHDHYEDVKSISLEDVFSKFNLTKIDYLKLDCEGAEVPFLLNKDLSKIDNIGMELHGYTWEPAMDLMRYILKSHTLIKKIGVCLYSFRIKK